jgi:hypothetical protein
MSADCSFLSCQGLFQDGGYATEARQSPVVTSLSQVKHEVVYTKYMEVHIGSNLIKRRNGNYWPVKSQRLPIDYQR